MTPTSKWMIFPVVLALAGTPFAFATDSADSGSVSVARSDAPAFSLPAMPSEASGSARTLALVQSIDAWHLSLLGETAPDLVRPAFDTAADAVAALAARHGASLPAVDALALQALPAGLSAPLARVLADFIVLEDESVRAFAGLDGAALLADPASAVGGIRLAGVIAAQQALLASALALQDAMEGGAGYALLAIHVAGVLHLDLTGECSDDVYTEDLPLIMDECGNDVYANNAGGASVLALDCNLPTNPSVVAMIPAAAVIDSAGNDAYVGQFSCGKNGGAFGGAGFLLDSAGNDFYDGANDGINGGAVAGSGLLIDEGGDDVYMAGGWGTNGGGYPGARGLLVDMDGNDAYDGTFDAVNGGAHLGIGTLWDDAGDDSYVAWGSGVNGGGTAGIGLLFDNAGHDLYEDVEGGSGEDVTVVPKELSGAQIDNA